mmetsp:Transcript_13662/g.32043  ORF Transcript_13662/g.32043 Transcript_13662/m.32043 type:complete len:256 (+) Transcript_13662:860-1627(+)
MVVAACCCCGRPFCFFRSPGGFARPSVRWRCLLGAPEERSDPGCACGCVAFRACRRGGCVLTVQVQWRESLSSALPTLAPPYRRGFRSFGRSVAHWTDADVPLVPESWTRTFRSPPSTVCGGRCSRSSSRSISLQIPSRTTATRTTLAKRAAATKATILPSTCCRRGGGGRWWWSSESTSSFTHHRPHSGQQSNSVTSEFSSMGVSEEEDEDEETDFEDLRRSSGAPPPSFGSSFAIAASTSLPPQRPPRPWIHL